MGTMSLKDFNLIMETENPAKKITFQWSIENIHKIPAFIRSSKFSLLPYQPKHWDVSICRKREGTFQFSLAYHAVKEAVPIRVSAVCSILKGEGSLMECNSQSTSVFHGGDRHPLFTRVKFPESDDNKFIFLCSMTVHGYGLECSRSLYSDDCSRDVEQLRNDYLNMMQSNEFADLEIQVGDTRFTAHRCVLKSLAPRFFSEHQDMIQEGQVTLGVAADVFEYVLQNIYCGTVNQIAIALDFRQFYEVAVRYALRSLQRASTIDIIYSMKIDNVCEFYELAEDNEDEKLVRYCEAFMKDNIRELVSKDEYNEFRASRPHLPMI